MMQHLGEHFVRSHPGLEHLVTIREDEGEDEELAHYRGQDCAKHCAERFERKSTCKVGYESRYIA
jgi:hypothetical protein